MQSASSPAGIQVGDLLPPFEAMTADGRPINLDGDALAGRPRLLVFVRDAEAPAVEAALQRLTAWADHLAHLDCRVFVALPLPPASAKAKAAALGLPFTILCDPDLKAARALTPAVLQASGPPLASLLLRPGRQVQAVLGAETEDHGDVACAYVEKLAPERAWQVQTGQQAPVLLLLLIMVMLRSRTCSPAARAVSPPQARPPVQVQSTCTGNIARSATPSWPANS